MFVVDAVGGTSQLEHRTDIERMIAAGAVPNTAFALLAELFVDWASPLAGKANCWLGTCRNLRKSEASGPETFRTGWLRVDYAADPSPLPMVRIGIIPLLRMRG